jgi:transcriptional regulator with XRE-family HTH domain
MENDNQFNIIFSKVIIRIRKEKGMSQEALAEQANLDRTYISGVERGARNITLKSLDKIICALGIKQVDFFKEIIDEFNIQKK